MNNFDCLFFFFNDTATTEIYTLSLHDALPISHRRARPPTVDRARAGAPERRRLTRPPRLPGHAGADLIRPPSPRRSEEHTSELQSRQYLVCRLLLEKKNNNNTIIYLV